MIVVLTTLEFKITIIINQMRNYKSSLASFNRLFFRYCVGQKGNTNGMKTSEVSRRDKEIDIIQKYWSIYIGLKHIFTI